MRNFTCCVVARFTMITGSLAARLTQLHGVVDSTIQRAIALGGSRDAGQLSHPSIQGKISRDAG